MQAQNRLRHKMTVPVRLESHSIGTPAAEVLWDENMRVPAPLPPPLTPHLGHECVRRIGAVDGVQHFQVSSVRLE